MAKKQLTLQHLVERVEPLEEMVAWMGEVLATQNISGPWVSPEVAARLLCVSRDRVMAEITAAENQRANEQQSDLTYGTHYRNIQDPQASRPTWQVNFVKFGEVLQIPPDRRRLS